jgi:uncharacterized protein YecT (DUF1311 family)
LAEVGKLADKTWCRNPEAWFISGRGIQYRDANCGFYGTKDGSIRQVQEAECIRAMTEERARELEKAMNFD